MKATPSAIAEVIFLEPKVFGDERGSFFESYNRNVFGEATGCNAEFVQDNHSCSTQWVLRGLHYQTAPKAQGKPVRVIQGKVFDVAVDIRRESPTLGKWMGQILSACNRQQLWIPPGFAHEFLTLSESAEFLYKSIDYYSPTMNDASTGMSRRCRLRRRLRHLQRSRIKTCREFRSRRLISIDRPHTSTQRCWPDCGAKI